MIYIVIGMSKSGTTLVAKTLHESGIDMNPGKTGNYNQSKYEDPDIIEILLKMFKTDRLQSLYIPDNIIYNKEIINEIKDYISKRSCKHEWGVKQPWLTLCYPEFRKLLPEHKVIGIERSFKGLISHWTKRNKKINEELLFTVQRIYRAKMISYDVPILNYENFLKYGPVELEKIVGMKLKDVREYDSTTGN
jgi:hypothetical protein